MNSSQPCVFTLNNNYCFYFSNVIEKEVAGVFGSPDFMLNHFYDEINKDRRTKDITEMESEGWKWDVGEFSRLNHPLHLMVSSHLNHRNSVWIIIIIINFAGKQRLLEYS